MKNNKVKLAFFKKMFNTKKIQLELDVESNEIKIHRIYIIFAS